VVEYPIILLTKAVGSVDSTLQHFVTCDLFCACHRKLSRCVRVFCRPIIITIFLNTFIITHRLRQIGRVSFALAVESTNHPPNLALFGHKITLYKFNQGAHTIAGGLNRSRGLSPLPPHFNHCVSGNQTMTRSYCRQALLNKMAH